MNVAAAKSGRPLFIRIFAMMVACVAVVQLLNLIVVLFVPPPTPRIVTIGQIAQALAAGDDRTGEFRFVRSDTVDTSNWSPRSERLRVSLAVALGVPASRVELQFPNPPFAEPQPVFDRSQLPPPVPPPNAAAARDVVVVGDFTASIRGADGRWLTVEPIRGGFDWWRWRALIWLLVALAAVAPFAWALARRLAEPIGAFAAAAERLGRDPRAPPLALTGPTELSEAAAAFNRMQARLNRYVDDRATIIAAVAHDMRTPLMRLGLRLEAAPEPVRRACESDIQDMEAMIGATMSFLRDVSRPGPRRPLDLRALAESVTDDLADRGGDVSLAPGEPVVIEGNSVALKALLENLVGNALKYAGSAEVSLTREPCQVTVEVRDNGPGIAETDMDHVFEPFFRGERSRNRDTGGIGLGLASARAVARAHGGEVTLVNRAEGGLLARVVLPV